LFVGENDVAEEKNSITLSGVNSRLHIKSAPQMSYPCSRSSK